MEQSAGIIIMAGAILVVLILVFSLRTVLGRKRAKKKPVMIENMKKAIEKAVPQAKGYPVVMAQADQSTMAMLKEAGEDFARQFVVAAVGAVFGVKARLKNDYGDLPPRFILAYREDEIYAVCVGYPVYDRMEPDLNCLLHLTKETVEKVRLGIGGGMTFCLKGGKKFIISFPLAAASEIEQAAEIQNFKAFVKGFAEIVNE